MRERWLICDAGKLNLSEFNLRTDHFLVGDPQVEHLHNKLIVGILANVGREPPDAGVAPWVSANDKPTAGLSKSTAGNEAERRLKTEVMQLPAKERRRLKDLPEPETRNPVPKRLLAYHHAKQLNPPSDLPPPSAGGLNRGNSELEIRKLYNQPLASETGEFPDNDTIQQRLTPLCFRGGLPNGASTTCAGYLATAAECYIKEKLSIIYMKTRLNMTGGSASGAMTHRFKQQLGQEEDLASRGLLERVNGLLPVEAREAANRRPIGMSDLKLAMKTGDSLFGQFPFLRATVEMSRPDGEHEENVQQRRNVFQELRQQQEAEARRLKLVEASDPDTKMNGVDHAGGQHDSLESHTSSSNNTKGPFGHFADDDDLGWQGGSRNARSTLNSLLDGVLSAES